MKKTWPLILALLLALACGVAQGAQWWFGGLAADTSFAGQPKWKAKLVDAAVAASEGDTLRQFGSSHDTLSAESTTAFDINLKVWGSLADTCWIVSSDGGTSASDLKFANGKTFTITDLNLYGGGLSFAGATCTWTGGSFTFPATGTKAVGTQGAIVMATAASNVTFDGCDLTSLSSGAPRIYTASDVNHKLTLKNLTCNLGLYGLESTWGGAGRITVQNCVLNAINDWGLAMDLAYVEITNSTWNSAEELWVLQADSVQIHHNRFLNWGYGAYNNAGLGMGVSATAGNRAARYANLTHNEFFPGDSTLGRLGIFLNDSLRSKYDLTGCVFGGLGAREDTLTYAIRSVQHHMDLVLDSVRVYAGAVYVVLADTTKAPGVHTANGLTIDHTSWDIAPSNNVALSCVTRGQTWDGLFVKSPCSHVMMFSSDDFSGKSPGRTTAFRYGGDMTLTRSTIWQMAPASGVAYGIVCKARNDKLINCILRSDGGPDGGSVYSFVGDTTQVINSIVIASDVGTVGGAFNSGTYTGMQTKGNAVYNCLIRGTADYSFISRSGDGSGVVETNNCWALAAGGFDEDGAMTMSALSFADSTSFKMKHGGKRGLAGIVANPSGTVPIGLNPPTGALAGGAPAPVVWWFKPSGVSAYDWVAGDVHALLALINDGTLPAVTLGDLSTYYLIPPAGLTGDAGRARRDDLERQWGKLSDANRAKIEWRVW